MVNLIQIWYVPGDSPRTLKGIPNKACLLTFSHQELISLPSVHFSSCFSTQTGWLKLGLNLVKPDCHIRVDIFKHRDVLNFVAVGLLVHQLVLVHQLFGFFDCRSFSFSSSIALYELKKNLLDTSKGRGLLYLRACVSVSLAGILAADIHQEEIHSTNANKRNE